MMTTQDFGPWVLLAVGALTLLGAGWITYGHPDAKRPLLMWIFGLASAGIGTYGPAFLTPYAKFITPLLRMQENPSEETYSDFFNQVAEGTIPEEYQVIGTTFALSHPIPGMDEALQKAIRGAKAEDGKRVLELAARELVGRQRAANQLGTQLEAGALSPTDARAFDTTTRIFLAEDLESRLPQGLERIRTEDIRLIRPVRPRR